MDIAYVYLRTSKLVQRVPDQLGFDNIWQPWNQHFRLKKATQLLKTKFVGCLLVLDPNWFKQALKINWQSNF